MKKGNNSIKLSRSNQLELVSEYYRFGDSPRVFALKKHIPFSTFYRWIRNFESSNPLMAESMQSQSKESKGNSVDELAALKSENARLQSELEYEKLRAHAYDTMIDVAEEMFHIPIRKKAGTKQ